LPESRVACPPKKPYRQPDGDLIVLQDPDFKRASEIGRLGWIFFLKNARLHEEAMARAKGRKRHNVLPLSQTRRGHALSRLGPRQEEVQPIFFSRKISCRFKKLSCAESPA
jgi:hypothetical protein